VSLVDKVAGRRISLAPRVGVHVSRGFAWHRKKSGFILLLSLLTSCDPKVIKEDFSLRAEHEPDNISNCNVFTFEVFSGDSQSFFIS